MSYKLIKDIKAGETVYQPWLVTKVERKATKQEKWYTRLTLSDNSGDLEVNCWALPDPPPDLQGGSFVLLKIIVDTFKGQLSAASKEAPTLCAEPENKEDYQVNRGLTKDQIDKSLIIINNAAELVKDSGLRKYLDKILKDDHMLKMFCEAPASTTNRQKYKGGLASHTSKVVTNALNLINNLEQNETAPYKINKDVVITSAIVHDIGKIYSYRLNNQGVAENTQRGSIEDHLLISYSLSCDFFKELKGVSQDLQDQVNHCILSHHGTFSPIKPRSVEAQLLHMADYADSSITTFMEDVLNGNQTSLPNIVEGTSFSNKKLFKING